MRDRPIHNGQASKPPKAHPAYNPILESSMPLLQPYSISSAPTTDPKNPSVSILTTTATVQSLIPTAPSSITITTTAVLTSVLSTTTSISGRIETLETTLYGTITTTTTHKLGKYHRYPTNKPDKAFIATLCVAILLFGALILLAWWALRWWHLRNVWQEEAENTSELGSGAEDRDGQADTGDAGRADGEGGTGGPSGMGGEGNAGGRTGGRRPLRWRDGHVQYVSPEGSVRSRPRSRSRSRSRSPPPRRQRNFVGGILGWVRDIFRSDPNDDIRRSSRDEDREGRTAGRTRRRERRERSPGGPADGYARQDATMPGGLGPRGEDANPAAPGRGNCGSPGARARYDRRQAADDVILPRANNRLVRDSARRSRPSRHDGRTHRQDRRRSPANPAGFAEHGGVGSDGDDFQSAASSLSDRQRPGG